MLVTVEDSTFTKGGIYFARRIPPNSRISISNNAFLGDVPFEPSLTGTETYAQVAGCTYLNLRFSSVADNARVFVARNTLTAVQCVQPSAAGVTMGLIQLGISGKDDVTPVGKGVRLEVVNNVVNSLNAQSIKDRQSRSVSITSLSVGVGSVVAIHGNQLSGANSHRIDARRFVFAARGSDTMHDPAVLSIKRNTITTTRTGADSTAEFAILMNPSYVDPLAAYRPTSTAIAASEGGVVIVEANAVSGYPNPINVGWPAKAATAIATSPHSLGFVANEFRGGTVEGTQLSAAVDVYASAFTVPKSTFKFSGNLLGVAKPTATADPSRAFVSFHGGFEMVGGSFQMAHNVGNATTERLRLIGREAAAAFSVVRSAVAFCNNTIDVTLPEYNATVFAKSGLGGATKGVAVFDYRCGCGEVPGDSGEKYCPTRTDGTCIGLNTDNVTVISCPFLATRRNPFPMIDPRISQYTLV